MNKSTATISLAFPSPRVWGCTVLSFLVTEVFGDRKSSQRNTSTGSRGFIHLTKDKRDLGFTIKLNDFGFLHFVVKIVSFTSTLAHSGEDGETTMCLGNVVLYGPVSINTSIRPRFSYNQLLNEHGLPDTCTAEQADLPSTSVRRQKIDDFDSGNKHLGTGSLVDELWRISMDRAPLRPLDRASLVDRVAGDVHDTTKGARADRNHNRATSIGRNGSTDETLGTCNKCYDHYWRKIASGCIPSIAIHRTTLSPKCCY